MTNANEGIRKELRAEGIYLWEIAHALGVSEGTMTRKMRFELSEQDKRAFKDAIRTIKKERRE